MKTYLSKLIIINTVLLLSFYSSSAQDWVSLSGVQTKEVQVKLLNSSLTKTTFSCELSGFFKQEVMTPNGLSLTLSLPNGVKNLKSGTPDIDNLFTSIVIPTKGNMSYRIISSTYQDFPNYTIAPSKGNIIRTTLPTDVPYKYGSVYNEDAMWPSNIITLNDPYILRDCRGQAISISPFQYNPHTKLLRVYKNIEFEVYQSSESNGKNELLKDYSITKVDREFKQIYASHFKNFNSLFYVPVEENGKLLIICNDDWIPAMAPFVDWKLKKGIPTEIIPVSTIGTNPAAIKTFVENYYNTNSLTYLLLVGDDAQVPSFFASNGASDPSYGYILGNDSYAEVFVGRFSAESVDDVATQVTRVLNYERNPILTNNWLSKGVVIGSNQGPGDDNEMDWEHAANMRTDLLNSSFTDVAELYDGTHPGTTDVAGDPSNIDLFNLFQSGIGVMTYTGHGSNYSCSTTGLSVADVQNMTNTGMLPFIWAVACVNGNFNIPGGPCFAESFLRARNNGLPTGAVATYMSSINQSWNPPMAAQDEMVDLLVNSYSNNIKRTFGGISVNGCLLMNDEYNTAGFEMTDTWHCFGDPSMEVRTALPINLAVTHINVTPVGTTSFSVNASVDSSLVSLTLNGAILGTGIVQGGVATITFNSLSIPDTLFITVTGYNLIPYEGFALIIPASGPYVTLQNSTMNEVVGNSNGAVDFGETITIDAELVNLGNTNSNSISAILTTQDPYVTISDNVETYSNIASGSSQLLSNAFTFSISNSIPDQHIIVFVLTCTDGSGLVTTSNILVTVNAPVMKLLSPIFSEGIGADGDGIIESGENAILTIRCSNIGHADALLSVASIATLSSYITLQNISVPVGNIQKQSYSDIQFNFSILSGLAVGTPFDLDITLNSGNYSDLLSITGNAGEIMETFESSNFSSYPWTFSGNAPWLISSTLPFEGNYCSVSSDINDNEISGLEISFVTSIDDSLSYYYKTDSEQDWDFLTVNLDGNLLAQYSGNINWNYASLGVLSGSHTLQFIYAKDAVYSIGQDCAWLDNIKFPSGTEITSVNEIKGQSSFNIWPNPANNELNYLSNSAKLNSAIIIYDIHGKIVLQNLMSAGKSGKIAINNLEEGLYFICIQDGQNNSYNKFVVKH